MIEIEVQGQIVVFPDGTSDDEIKGALRLMYPSKLEPGQVRCGKNGSVVSLDQKLGCFVIRDWRGMARAHRQGLADAISLADRLPAKPPEKLKQPVAPKPQPAEQWQPSAQRAAAISIHNDVQRHVEQQQRRIDREHAIYRQNQRYRNHGTTRRKYA